MPHWTPDQIAAWIGSLSVIVTTIIGAAVKIAKVIRDAQDAIHEHLDDNDERSTVRSGAVLDALKEKTGE